MTSAPPPSASPGRQINAAFPCAMPRSAPPTRAGSPSRRRQEGARFALASLLVLGLGALAAGCASAEDTPDQMAEATAPTHATQASSSPALPASQPGARPKGPSRRLPPGITLASMAPPAAGRAFNSPRAACLDAARQSEAVHGIPPGLMVAVTLAESGLHAFAMNIGGRSHFPSNTDEARRLYNTAGPGQHLMAGCVQVNARVHAAGSDWPLDPWRAADWGAAYLRSHYEKSGSWAEALRRWNGGGAAGNRLACRVQAKLAVTNPGSTLLSGVSCGSDQRERRNGRALLEIAESSD